MKRKQRSSTEFSALAADFIGKQELQIEVETCRVVFHRMNHCDACE